MTTSQLDYSTLNLSRFALAALTRLFELKTFMPKPGDVFFDPEGLVDPLVVEALVENGWHYEVLFNQDGTRCTMGLVAFMAVFQHASQSHSG